VAGGLTEPVEIGQVHRRLLLAPVLLLGLAAVPTASGSTPAGGSLDRVTTSRTWSGSVPVQTAGFSGLGCQPALPDPTCDFYALSIGDLAGTDADGAPLPDDVRIAISTSAPSGTIAEFDLYVYDAAGTLVASDTDLGSNDTVTLRDVAAGTYTVGVQSPLSTDPTATYDARADVIDAGPDVPVDAESDCGLESNPDVRELDKEAGIGAAGVIGDPTAATDGIDTSERITLNVRVVLDGVTPEEADAIFAGAAQSYVPLGIDLVRDGDYTTHEFGTNDGLAIIDATKQLFGGARPNGVDVVEALVGYDIQQLGQSAVAGIADCIGGVAHADRAFLVAEGHTPTDVAIGPAVFDADANAHVTAHEIGHLMGGQHHYANCVEGIQATDARDDGTLEGSPCTLMFNAADFLGGNFGSLNAAIVRGSAVRSARPSRHTASAPPSGAGSIGSDPSTGRTRRAGPHAVETGSKSSSGQPSTPARGSSTSNAVSSLAAPTSDANTSTTSRRVRSAVRARHTPAASANPAPWSSACAGSGVGRSVP
jgi:hypothetical protein